MTIPSNSAHQVFLQGQDFKARNWACHFNRPVRNFTTAREMLSVLMASRRGDVVIFRYQNNPPRIHVALFVLLIIAAQVLKAKTTRQKIVWICHNVDRETLPYHPLIQRLRRSLLFRFADLVLVLDPAFVAHCKRPDARAISFGSKEEGSISPDNLALIEELAQHVERIVLIAGQDGGKYKAFERIPEIFSRFAELGLSVGFVTAGMASSRIFDSPIEQNLLRIVEPNIREAELSHVVDYVYRENADISVPFSIYAAATAKIPVLTRGDNILAEIVERERIGTILSDVENLKDQKYDFDGFLQRHSWKSLNEQLLASGILQ